MKYFTKVALELKLKIIKLELELNILEKMSWNCFGSWTNGIDAIQIGIEHPEKIELKLVFEVEQMELTAIMLPI